MISCKSWLRASLQCSGPYSRWCSRSSTRPPCSTLSWLVSIAELKAVIRCLVHALLNFFVIFCSHRVRIISPHTPAAGEEVGEGCTWLPRRAVSMKRMHKAASRPEILESWAFFTSGWNLHHTHTEASYRYYCNHDCMVSGVCVLSLTVCIAPLP